MKKYVGAIASGLAGILTFVFLSIDGLITKITSGGMSVSESVNAWDIIKEEGMEISGFTLYKVAVILMIIVASLLIISAILMILKNAKVFKSKVKFDLINNILLSVFAIITILAFIGACIMGGDMTIGDTMITCAGVGSWLNMIVGILACVSGWVFARKK